MKGVLFSVILSIIGKVYLMTYGCVKQTTVFSSIYSICMSVLKFSGHITVSLYQQFSDLPCLSGDTCSAFIDFIPLSHRKFYLLRDACHLIPNDLDGLV